MHRSGTWYTILQPYVKNYQVLICPTAGLILNPTNLNNSNGYTSNGLYAIGYGKSYVPVLHGGQVGPFYQSSGLAAVTFSGGGNYLFADGHVKYLNVSQSYCSSLWDVDKTITTHSCSPYHS